MQVELVRAQLERAAKRYGGRSITLSRASSQPVLNQEVDMQPLNRRVMGTLHVENIGNIDHEVKVRAAPVPKGNGSQHFTANQISHESEMPRNSSASTDVYQQNVVDPSGELDTTHNSLEENKKADPPVVPDDFLCPISLEVMRDPVIVATGQVWSI